MLNFIFCKKSIVSLTTVLRANRALSRGRRVLRTQKNPKVSRLGRLVNFLPHSVVDHAQLIRIERDPQRSVFLGLFRFLRSGFLSYMLLPFGCAVGDICVINYHPTLSNNKNLQYLNYNFFSFEIKPLVLFTKGSTVHNLESSPLAGFKFCRSAGSSAVLEAVSLTLGIAKILLPSGKFAYLPASSYAASGSLSNNQHHSKQLRKAGQSVWKGIRPVSRGVAMNPVDHPHGGGEGKTSGGRPSVSFSAVLTKGYRTLKYKKKKDVSLLKRRFEVFG